jgi:phosphate starvation-inducible protein PhoH and related proteins
MSISTTIELPHIIDLDGIDPGLLFGPQDLFLLKIEKAFGARFSLRDEQLRIVHTGQDMQSPLKAITELKELIRRKGNLQPADVDLVIKLIQNESDVLPLFHDNSKIVNTPTGPFKTRTAGQEYLYRQASCNMLTFAIGPAGTGKTWLAVAMAVAALNAGKVSRIILTRPAVEAGESLGFLPGDLKEKVDPYLRPLFDSLLHMMDADKLSRLLTQQIIEIAPMAFMRGRTLNNSFVILDEAQNTTIGQMKMFLTRLGMGSQAIITGDVTQVDLGGSTQSGLIQIQDVLEGVRDIAFVHLEKSDVIRHRLVRDIINAYEEFDKSVSNFNG